MAKPNIILMISDDHHFDAIRAFDNPEIATPNFDSLIAEGTALNGTYIMGSTSPAVCIASRAMMLTGRSLFHAPDPIPQNIPLLPEILRQAGYTTYGIGKWHNRRETYARSFTGGAKIFFDGMSDHDKVPVYDFDPKGNYPPEDQYFGEQFSTNLFGNAAVNFLNTYQEDQPFFLYIAFTAPHDPRTPPEEYTYDPETLSLPENFLPEHPFDNGELTIRDEKLAPWPRTPEVIRQHIADYYGMISHMDATVGKIRNALAESKHANNTIILYMADHGLAVGRHGLMGKQNLYEHSMHVPLIFQGPGIPAGHRSNTLCYLYDVFPTVCDLTNCPIPKTCEGHSLLPLLRNYKSVHRDSIFAAYQPTEGIPPEDKYQRMVRDERYKLIEYFVAGERHTQLFDLVQDPHEMNNLAADPTHAEHLVRLRRDLAQWQRVVDDPVADK